MARRHVYIRVGTSNPENYEQVTITKKVVCDYYLKIKGRKPELLDPIRQEDLILHLLKNFPELIERRNIREEVTTVYIRKESR